MMLSVMMRPVPGTIVLGGLVGGLDRSGKGGLQHMGMVDRDGEDERDHRRKGGDHHQPFRILFHASLPLLFPNENSTVPPPWLLQRLRHPIASRPSMGKSDCGARQANPWSIDNMADRFLAPHPNNQGRTMSNFSHSQIVRKQVTATSGGVVAAQHRVAAEAGAAVLDAGGDAIDAAIATSFAIGVVEQWMSGPAGGGALTLWREVER
jgi:hypothetical protein